MKKRESRKKLIGKYLFISEREVLNDDLPVHVEGFHELKLEVSDT
jgi:hypothetical protein